MATKKATTKAKTKTKAASAAKKSANQSMKQERPLAAVVPAVVSGEPASPQPAVVKPQQPVVTAGKITPGAFGNLRRLNLWLALALGVQAIGILLFAGSKTTPVTMQYPAIDQLASDVAGHPVTALATRHIFDMSIGLTAAKALAVLAVTCVVIATIGRKYYERQLQNGSHVARWLSFGLGGGLMVVALAQLIGFTNIGILALMLVLTVLGFSLEPVAEKFKRERGGKLAHALCAAAITAAVTPWLVLAGAVAGALLWDGHLPHGFYGMAGITALFFCCWALGSHFRVRNQGKWADVLYTEKMYMFLTLAASSVLAWQIFVEAL